LSSHSSMPEKGHHAAPAGRQLSLGFTSLSALLLISSMPSHAEAPEAAGATAGEIVLSPMSVTGEFEQSPNGPVEGYVAKRSLTATKTNTAIADTAQSISVVTADQMRDQGVQSVQDALRYTAGVRAEPFGLDSRGDWSKIRGIDPVIFQDGMQQSFGYYASVRPDPFTLERIEVLKGPASVLYGQGSVGGLVNLVSKRPLSERQGEVQLQYGSFDRRQIGLDVTGAVDEGETLLVRAVAVLRESDTQVDQVADDRLLFMPSLTWRPNDSLEWTLLANVQSDESGSTTQFLPHAGTVYPAPGGLPEIPIDILMSEPGFDAYNTDQKALTSLLTYRIDDTWTLRQNLRYAKSEVDYRTLYPAFPPELQPNGDIARVIWVAEPELEALTADHQAQAIIHSGAIEHTVLAGLDYQHAVTNRRTAYVGDGGILNLYNPVYGNFTPPAAADFSDDPENTIEQLGVYAQHQMNISDRWFTTLGLRSDRASTEVEGERDQKDDAITLKAGLLYKTELGLSPYISYAESFLPEVGLNARGNAYKPLEGEQVEVGVKYQPDGSASFASIALYTLREQNRLVPDPVNPTGQIQAGEAQAQGIELEGLWVLTPNWDLISSYAFTATEVTEGTPGVDEGARLPSVAEHLASVWSQHRFAVGGLAGFSAGAGVRYVGASYDGEDKVKTPDYTLVDAMIGYETRDWQFALNGTNLADKTYYTTCLARGDCFVGTKRTVVASVGYRF